MQILHVITEGGTGGAQAYVRDLATEQQQRGHDVVVVAGTVGAMTDTLQVRGIATTVMADLVRRPSARQDVRALRELRSLISRTLPDVVHCHSSKAGVIGRAAARSTRVASVYTAHGWPFRHGGVLGQRAFSFVGEWVASRLGDRVICVSQEEANLARRWRVVPRARLDVVHPALPDRVVPHLPGDGVPRIVSICRFAPPKLPTLLIDTLAELTEVAWVCSIGGDGPLRADVEEAIQRNGLGSRVAVLGQIEDPDTLLQRADLFVLLSESEGMPVAVLEAMRAGVAVVASDLPGIRVELASGAAGLLTANEPARIAAALRTLLEQPERRRDLGRAARDEFERGYQIGPAAELIDAVYERAIHAR